MSDKKPCFVWTEEVVQIVKDRYVKDGPVKLAAELGTSRMSVTMKARRLGVLPKKESKPFEWTEEMLATLRELYPTADKATLIEKIGLPIYVIRHKANVLGLRSVMRLIFSAKAKSANNTSCDIHFFDAWSDEMAYVLGFLFADGNITKRLCESVIGLAIKDRCIIDYIRKVTKSTRKLEYREAFVDKHGHKHQKTVFLILSSKILVRRLMELGIYPRKTYRDDPFPDVPDKFLPHFIRGYFDGDGGLRGELDEWVSVGIIGSPRFITGLRDSLVRVLGMKCNPVRLEETKGTTCGRISWGAVEDLQKFRAFIYPEGYAFCLQRKKDRIDQWLARWDSTTETEQE